MRYTSRATKRRRLVQAGICLSACFLLGTVVAQQAVAEGFVALFDFGINIVMLIAILMTCVVLTLKGFRMLRQHGTIESFRSSTLENVTMLPPVTLPPMPTISVSAQLRSSRPDSVLLNAIVTPLESDGDVLKTPWAIGAFLDVVQYGVTGAQINPCEPIHTAQREVLDIGIRIAAEVVGTKIPARLPELLEQRQFLVTACILRHYELPAADDVRTALAQWGYDPQLVWGAVDAYLSGYYHCRSWRMAQRMSARQLRLPRSPGKHLVSHSGSIDSSHLFSLP